MQVRKRNLYRLLKAKHNLTTSEKSKVDETSVLLKIAVLYPCEDKNHLQIRFFKNLG